MEKNKSLTPIENFCGYLYPDTLWNNDWFVKPAISDQKLIDVVSCNGVYKNLW